ncbi:hypothetical protein BSYN_27830 [Bacteroides sedimenti]|uniref:Uncharacterized protein n=1 Tax=Bacteroides sedimenti TaxID=2136147 RepID=A0ABN6Z7I9_9BACE
MNLNIKKYINYIVNLIISIPILGILFFVSSVSLASAERQKKIISDSLMDYFFTRLLVDFVIILIAILILWIVNKLLKYCLSISSYKSKILLYEFIIYLLASIMFIIFKIISVQNYSIPLN